MASLRDLPEDHELVELEFLEIKAQALFEKRTTAEKFPGLTEPTAWNTFKLQFVAIKSLFQSKAMFKRVVAATVTMFFQVRSSMPKPKACLTSRLAMDWNQRCAVSALDYEETEQQLTVYRRYYAPQIFQQLGMDNNTT